jgi:hypothetical protein
VPDGRKCKDRLVASPDPEQDKGKEVVGEQDVKADDNDKEEDAKSE